MRDVVLDHGGRVRAPRGEQEEPIGQVAELRNPKHVLPLAHVPRELERRAPRVLHTTISTHPSTRGAEALTNTPVHGR